MLESGQVPKMPAEILLALLIVLRESDRTEEFGRLIGRVCTWAGLEPDGRAMIGAELEHYRTRVGSSASIMALRALHADHRTAIARQLLEFAAGDPLLSPHRRRLSIRVYDILALDAPLEAEADARRR